MAHSLTAAYTSGRDLEADSVTNGDSAVWIEDGEKYALIGLNVKIDGHLPPGKIAPNLWVLADTKFNVPPHWQEWLGSIRAQEGESCKPFPPSQQALLKIAITFCVGRGYVSAGARDIKKKQKVSATFSTYYCC